MNREHPYCQATVVITKKKCSVYLPPTSNLHIWYKGVYMVLLVPVKSVLHAEKKFCGCAFKNSSDRLRHIRHSDVSEKCTDAGHNHMELKLPFLQLFLLL